ncbi:class I SAM-dependent methyltransferase [Cohnella sp.]|uniref:class I SAM-dependent methyltransferase n=1 Tax=Cohnella sp. TaxID=1883426 RepID=UPI003561633F
MEPLETESPLSIIIRDRISDSLEIGRTDSGKELSAIPFHQYMMLCLYHPEFGYYRAGASRVGREGDFYTSAYVGDLMGEQLASEIKRLAKERFADAESIEVIDWGGGTGRLGRQLLESWEKEDESEGLSSDMRRRFILTIIDENPEHRRLASEHLKPYILAGKARVLNREEGEALTLSDHPVVIVANELLDAFPVYRLVQRAGRLLEWGVTWDEEKLRFIPCVMEPTNPRLVDWINEEGITLLNNQTIEVNLDAAQWLTNIVKRLNQAIMVLIDYGDEREELIASHRMDGTLLCYYKHRAHNDPYVFPGEQDITAHVNFSHIRRSALDRGCKELFYGTQKKFLVESGILNKLSSHTLTDPFHPLVRRNRAIRQLLLSDGMSELFKVQIFHKNV